MGGEGTGVGWTKGERRWVSEDTETTAVRGQHSSKSQILDVRITFRLRE